MIINKTYKSKKVNGSSNLCQYSVNKKHDSNMKFKTVEKRVFKINHSPQERCATPHRKNDVGERF